MHDHETWLNLRAKQGKGNVVKAMLGRSLFNTTPVEQYVEAFKDRGWKMDERFSEYEDRRSLRLYGSQMIEDGIHHIKAKVTASPNKRLCDTTIYKQPIERKVAEEIHHFKSPADVFGDVAAPSMTFDDEMFTVDPNNASPILAEIKGTVSKTDWFTPRVDEVNVPHADLVLGRFLEATGRDEDHTDEGELDLIALLRDQDAMIVRHCTAFPSQVIVVTSSSDSVK